MQPDTKDLHYVTGGTSYDIYRDQDNAAIIIVDTAHDTSIILPANELVEFSDDAQYVAQHFAIEPEYDEDDEDDEDDDEDDDEN